MKKFMIKQFFINLRKEIQKRIPQFISFAQKIFNYFHFVYQFCQKNLDTFNQNFPKTTQNIQLSFVFFFALIDLIYSVLNNVFSFGYFPEILMPVFPFIESVLLSPYFSIWASPEKVFLMSFLVIELMIVRSVFKLSKLVKYYILLIFALLMLQGLSVSYWDLIFNREITHNMSKWALDKSLVIYTDKQLAIFFFFNTFLFFIGLYCYLYFCAMQGKFATIPGCDWLTDSIAFWLRIKTPTMRFGNGNQKNQNKPKPKPSDDDELFDNDDLDEDDEENPDQEDITKE